MDRSDPRKARGSGAGRRLNPHPPISGSYLVTNDELQRDPGSCRRPQQESATRSYDPWSHVDSGERPWRDLTNFRSLDSLPDLFTKEPVNPYNLSLMSPEVSPTDSDQAQMQIDARSTVCERSVSTTVERSIEDNSPSHIGFVSPSLSDSTEPSGSDMDRMARGTILQRPRAFAEETVSRQEPFPEYSESDSVNGWSAGIHNDLEQELSPLPSEHNSAVVPLFIDPGLIRVKDGPFFRPMLPKPLRRGPKLELNTKTATRWQCRRNTRRNLEKLYNITPKSRRGSCDTCKGRRKEFSAMLKEHENADKSLMSRVEITAREREIDRMLLESSGDCGHVDYLHWALRHPELKPNRHDRCPCNTPWLSDIAASPERIVDSPRSSIFIDSPLSTTHSTDRAEEYGDGDHDQAYSSTHSIVDSVIDGSATDSDLPLPEMGPEGHRIRGAADRDMDFNAHVPPIDCIVDEHSECRNEYNGMPSSDSDRDLPLPEIRAEGYETSGAANGSMSSGDLVPPSCLVVEQQGHRDDGYFARRVCHTWMSVEDQGLRDIGRRSSRPPTWAIIACGVALMLSVSCLTLAASLIMVAKMLAVTAP